MNCPGHMQIYNQQLRSYRDLPLRLAEFGRCHRNEPSGALHGLMRVRAFTQDDAHMFCTAAQITEESAEFASCCSTSTAVSGSTTCHEARGSATEARRRRRSLGPGRGRAGGGDGGAAALHAEPGRGRVLRPEDRVRAARRDRARLAMRHAASRLCCPGGSTRSISARTAPSTDR